MPKGGGKGKRKALESPAGEPDAKQSRSSGTLRITDMPDALISLVCKFLEEGKDDNHRCNAVLRLRLVSKRFDRWLANLAYDPEVFELECNILTDTDIENLFRCPFKERVSQFKLQHLAKNCMIELPELLQSFPSAEALSMTMRERVQDIVSSCPNLKTLTLHGDEFNPEEDVDLPIAPKLQRINLRNTVHLPTRDFSKLGTLYLDLQEIRISNFPPSKNTIPLVLPRRLRVLEVPEWLFLLSEVQPDTVAVIDNLRVHRTFGIVSNLPSAYDCDVHIRQNMSRVSVGRLSVYDDWLSQRDVHRFFEWGITFTGTLHVRVHLPERKRLMHLCMRRPLSAILAMFKLVEIHLLDASSAAIVVVVGYCSVTQEIEKSMNEHDISSTTIRICSEESKRGSCTLRYNSKYEMFDLEWDELPLRGMPLF